MTNPKEQSHEIGTLLRLIAPEAVEVELVPLAVIEKAEFLFFWSTIFLTVWGALLGTWLSLTAIKYENQPVLYLLLVALIFITALVFAFTYAGFKARNKARQTARSIQARPGKLPMPEKMDRVVTFVVNILADEFTEEDFKKLVDRLDEGNNDIAFQTVLFDRAIASKAVIPVDESKKPSTYQSAKKMAMPMTIQEG